MRTLSLALILIGIAGLAFIWKKFPTAKEFRAIRKNREPIIGLPPFSFFIAAFNAVLLGLAIQLIYFVFPDP